LKIIFDKEIRRKEWRWNNDEEGNFDDVIDELIKHLQNQNIVDEEIR
jgi:hypothetical protein